MAYKAEDKYRNMGCRYSESELKNLPDLERQKEIALAQLAIVLVRTLESEKGGGLGHYLDIIGSDSKRLKVVPDIKKESLIVIIPFDSERFKDDWKQRLDKVQKFLKDKKITPHYFKNGGQGAIAIDTSAGDNAKIIEWLYQASEKTFEEKSRTPRPGNSVGR